MALPPAPTPPLRVGPRRTLVLLMLGCLTTAGCVSTGTLPQRGASAPYGAALAPSPQLHTYTRAELEHTGRIGNLGDALATLDPSISITRH